MADSGQGRGRARGRAGARGQPQQPQTTGRAVTRTPAPTGGAGGPPPGFRQPQQQQQSQQPSSGRAAHRGGPHPTAAGDSGATGGLQTKFADMSLKGSTGDNGGNGAAQIGRGTHRGRRVIGQPDLLRTRPESCVSKQGSYGEPIVLRANYFKILTKPDYTLYQYRVDMAPEEDRTFVKRALLRVHAKSIGHGYIFDGTVLYTFRRLSPDPVELFSKRESDGENVRITIKLVGDIKQGDCHYLQIYNIIIRKCLGQLDLKLLNRNYYDPEARRSIPDYSLELWPGYITSMRQHDGGILLCTEIVHKVLRLDTAYQVMETAHRSDPSNYQKAFMAQIIGQIVLTTYGNTQTYRIDDVDFNANPSSTFDFKGQQTSYIQYYKTKYGIQIRNTTQPMLISKPKARDVRGGRSGDIYLVPELCQMTGLTDDMRANNNLMRALADQTRMGSDVRQQRLLAFSNRFHSVGAITQELNNWQLQLDRQLITVNARRLPAEHIVQGNIKYPAVNVDWTNNLRSNKMLENGVLDHWFLITMKKLSRETQQFVDMTISAARGMSFSISPPKVFEVPDDRISTLVDALDKILSRENPKLVFIVVSNNRADRYNAVKKKTYVDRAVPSQVLCARTMTRKGAMSIATKVAIQLNCKIGGSPWTVDIPLGGLMVVGYDVCHDSQQKANSYGAMVASLNRSLSRYFSTVTPHSSGDEVFSDLGLNIGKAIHQFKIVNEGKLPERILIYRDGVGEGQLPIVMEHEIKAVKDALAEIYRSQPPKMTFIVVTKRINTRLFYNKDNPPAGTVVDDTITHPEKFDFFLISQSVRQGSVSPTGYNIVYDTSNLGADKLQRLTYKMTHLYYNWSGTVRVPAQCQYAHKLAFLVGQNLHRPPNVELGNLLYFL